MSKRTETLIWILYAFTCGLLLTLQVLAIQERRTVARSSALSSPMTSPLTSPIDTGKRQTTGKFDLHITSGGTSKKAETISQPTATVTSVLTATPSPMLPETGGDLNDATN